VTRHIVQFSGGIGSFAAALRVAAAHGLDDLVLLTADTRVEDADLWRFAEQAADYIGVPLTVVADGRTPFEVFADQRFLGNSRLAPCSIHLKQRPCRQLLREHTDPADTILYVGIDGSEQHRTGGIEHGWPAR
jgi:3'-phosphoadenosine 5'-phosphosulfate sulfotransferase (PAPS reductase)/FAD synthetase